MAGTPHQPELYTVSQLHQPLRPGAHLFMTSFSTMELSTTRICSGILTSTEMRPRDQRVRAVTQCPPGPSRENGTMSVGGLPLSWSLKKKGSDWSNLPAARSLSKNWYDSVQMVLGNRQVKSLYGQKESEGLPKARPPEAHHWAHSTFDHYGHNSMRLSLGALCSILQGGAVSVPSSACPRQVPVFSC